MNTTRLLLGLVLLTAFIAVAQTNSTNSVPTVPGLPGASSEPTDASLAKLLVAVIVPLIVAGIKKLAPNIPTVWLPVFAIALGAGADWVGSLVGAWQGSMIIGIVLGASGIGLREAGDQIMKAKAAASDPSSS